MVRYAHRHLASRNHHLNPIQKVKKYKNPYSCNKYRQKGIPNKFRMKNWCSKVVSEISYDQNFDLYFKNTFFFDDFIKHFSVFLGISLIFRPTR